MRRKIAFLTCSRYTYKWHRNLLFFCKRRHSKPQNPGPDQNSSRNYESRFVPIKLIRINNPAFIRGNFEYLSAVLRIRIRDPVPFWPLDLRWVKYHDPDPGWTTRIIVSLETILGQNTSALWYGSGMEKIRIRNTVDRLCFKRLILKVSSSYLWRNRWRGWGERGRWPAGGRRAPPRTCSITVRLGGEAKTGWGVAKMGEAWLSWVRRCLIGLRRG